MSDSLPISRRRDLGLGATLAAGVGLSACGEGGDKGGEIIASGTPEDVAKVSDSYTGQFLARILGLEPRRKSA